MKKGNQLFWIYITSITIIIPLIIYLALAASSEKDTLTQVKKLPISHRLFKIQTIWKTLQDIGQQKR